MAEVDARTGLEIVWQKNGNRYREHSILRVPNDRAFVIEYSKPSLGLLLQLKPTEALRWSVQGLVDGDTVANLGFHVNTQRRGQTPPIVTEEDIEGVRQFGSVDSSGQPSLWQVDLEVPVNNIYAFLDQVWNPHVQETDPDPRRLWHLTKVGAGYKDIPQKESDWVGLRIIPQ